MSLTPRDGGFTTFYSRDRSQIPCRTGVSPASCRRVHKHFAVQVHPWMEQILDSSAYGQWLTWPHLSNPSPHVSVEIPCKLPFPHHSLRFCKLFKRRKHSLYPTGFFPSVTWVFSPSTHTWPRLIVRGDVMPASGVNIYCWHFGNENTSY